MSTGSVAFGTTVQYSLSVTSGYEFGRLGKPLKAKSGPAGVCNYDVWCSYIGEVSLVKTGPFHSGQFQSPRTIQCQEAH